MSVCGVGRWVVSWREECQTARMKCSTGTLVVFGVILLGLITAVTGGIGVYLAQRGPLEQPVKVIVEPGMGVRAIAARLQGAQVIAHQDAFVALVKATGMGATLKAGEYAFEPGISLRAVVNKLALGDTENRSVTIPEGWTVKQAIDRLEAAEGLTGHAARPEEGRMFPDTYAFRFGAERRKVLETMTSRMDEELAKAWAARDTTLPLTSPDELLILASIVQKEAANEEEMPMIAAVFYNRLKKGMRLQSDPTVMYGAELEDNRLKKKDLTEPHPFNTYLFAGLPPTPIANPGRAALMAAARPAQTEALFFVADPSLTMHVFSATYAEHQKNVVRYWKDVKKTLLPKAVANAVVTTATAVVSATAKE